MLKLKKSLGQNFLIDKNIIKKIIKLDNIENQIIIEIGPGSGNLTELILKEKPKKVLLIEKDRRFSELLKNKFKKENNLKIYNQDILEFNLESIKFKNFLVFGNLPYNISTKILAKFISLKTWPPLYKKVIFMFQKEVADRILAETNTKEYGRISILSNYRLDVLESFNISRNCFFPKPDVDSKIIVFKPKAQIKYNVNIKNLEKVTNIFFSNRRKMINKPFSKLFKNYKEVAKKLKTNLNCRPSELSSNDYFRITEFYENL